MKESIIQKKSYIFAVRIIKLYKYLVENYKEYELSKQILRSGTSVGSNIEEAEGGFRLRLLYDTEFINKKMYDSLLTDCEELLKIMGKIQITMKNKARNS